MRWDALTSSNHSTSHGERGGTRPPHPPPARPTPRKKTAGASLTAVQTRGPRQKRDDATASQGSPAARSLGPVIHPAQGSPALTDYRSTQQQRLAIHNIANPLHRHRGGPATLTGHYPRGTSRERHEPARQALEPRVPNSGTLPPIMTPIEDSSPCQRLVFCRPIRRGVTCHETHKLVRATAFPANCRCATHPGKTEAVTSTPPSQYSRRSIAPPRRPSFGDTSKPLPSDSSRTRVRPRLASIYLPSVHWLPPLTLPGAESTPQRAGELPPNTAPLLDCPIEPNAVPSSPLRTGTRW